MLVLLRLSPSDPQAHPAAARHHRHRHRHRHHRPGTSPTPWRRTRCASARRGPPSWKISSASTPYTRGALRRCVRVYECVSLRWMVGYLRWMLW